MIKVPYMRVFMAQCGGLLSLDLFLCAESCWKLRYLSILLLGRLSEEQAIIGKEDRDVHFSIIVPVYNNAFYLRTCIESVRTQQYTDWELLLVDDGSSDGSEAVVDEYSEKDTRIKAIHECNSGAFIARRTGLSNSSGDYILFLDSDDRVEYNCLSVLNAVVEEKDPDIILFAGKHYYNNTDTGKRFGTIYNIAADIDVAMLKYSLIASHDFNSLCNKAFKRSLFNGDESHYEGIPRKCVGEDKIQLLYPLSQAKSLLLYTYNSSGM